MRFKERSGIRSERSYELWSMGADHQKGSENKGERGGGRGGEGGGEGRGGGGGGWVEGGDGWEGGAEFW